MRFPWDEGSAKRRTSLVVLIRIGNESAGIDPICGIAVGGRLVSLAETQPEFLMPSPIRKLWDFVGGLGIPLDWLLSAAVVLVWVLAMALLTGDVASALTGGAFALLPLAFIWFKDPISEIVGSFGFHQIDAASPPGFVAFFGWLGLAALIWYSLQQATV